MSDHTVKETAVPSGALLTLAGINMIWGAMFPFTKTALETIPPFTFTLLRFIVAMIIILPLAGRETLVLLWGPDRLRLAIIGLLGFCMAQVSQTLALKLSTAADIALLSTTSPLWIAFLARMWLGERLNGFGGLGFLFAIAGLLFILWPKESGGPLGMSQRVLGDAIFMVTGFTWACYNVMGKALMERYPPLRVTAAAGIIGTVGIIPFAAFELLSGQIPEFTLVGVAGVAYAGLLGTALGFVVLFWALGLVPAIYAGILMYLQPLAGVVIAWLLLQEPLGVKFLIGSSLVLCGAYLVTCVGQVSIKREERHDQEYRFKRGVD